MRHLNADQQRKQLQAIKMGLEWAYGKEKCYNCGHPCMGDYYLSVCEDAEPEGNIFNAPFCEICFSHSFDN